MYKHVFGPVPSRRLGISLGVDLVINKSCNLNCIFCECGSTKELTLERRSFKDIEEIKYELKNILKSISPDYITFSGSGEPTLSKDLGNVIKFIKKDLKYSGKIALITNSYLLSSDEVINEILDCDLIIPTLNTTIQDIFKQIARPDENAKVENILNGLKKLSLSSYKGKIFLETFILEDINDDFECLEELANFIKTLKYDKLQLNSLARPGTVKELKTVPYKKLEKIKFFLENLGIKNIEIIGNLEEISTDKKILINDDLFNNMKQKREYSKEEIKKIYKI